MNKSALEFTVSEDGSVVEFRIRDNKGGAISFTVGVQALDNLTIGFVQASKLAHDRFREAAIKAAREGHQRRLQS